MNINKKPRVPLRFKQVNRETVIARDCVKTVKLLQSRDLRLWWVEVNDISVWLGKEAGARKQYARALRYIP
jgi:hypothetical protein